MSAFRIYLSLFILIARHLIEDEWEQLSANMISFKESRKKRDGDKDSKPQRGDDDKKETEEAEDVDVKKVLSDIDNILTDETKSQSESLADDNDEIEVNKTSKQIISGNNMSLHKCQNVHNELFWINLTTVTKC